jgi:hypothetical protein
MNYPFTNSTLLLINYLWKWIKLTELRLIPSGHIMLFFIVFIEFRCCWGWLLLNDSIAKSPVSRPKRVTLTTREMAATIWIHRETNIRTRSMWSAKRNLNRMKEINRNVFLLNILTSWITLTSFLLSICTSSSFFFLRSHWRQRNKLWIIIKNSLYFLLGIDCYCNHTSWSKVVDYFHYH